MAEHLAVATTTQTLFATHFTQQLAPLCAMYPTRIASWVLGGAQTTTTTTGSTSSAGGGGGTGTGETPSGISHLLTPTSLASPSLTPSDYGLRIAAAVGVPPTLLDDARRIKRNLERLESRDGGACY